MASNIYEEKPKSNKKQLQSDLLYGVAKGIGGAILKEKKI